MGGAIKLRPIAVNRIIPISKKFVQFTIVVSILLVFLIHSVSLTVSYVVCFVLLPGEYQ